MKKKKSPQWGRPKFGSTQVTRPGSTQVDFGSWVTLDRGSPVSNRPRVDPLTQVDPRGSTQDGLTQGVSVRPRVGRTTLGQPTPILGRISLE